MVEPIIVTEWDSDSFHKRVLDMEAKGYTTRQDSYRIIPEMDPETGEIIHQHTIEMDFVGADPVENDKGSRSL